MAKFTGVLAVVQGYEQTDYGIYSPVIVEHKIAGDLLQSYVDVRSGEKVNDDLNISNRFSFYASPKLISILSAQCENVSPMYLVYLGSKLKVTNIQLNPPRVTVTTGGLYRIGSGDDVQW